MNKIKVGDKVYFFSTMGDEWYEPICLDWIKIDCDIEPIELEAP